jgi:single-strand DNA-binding protein
MQQIIVTGHIGKDAEIITPNNGGKDFMTFSIAETERWKNAAGEKQERTQWWKINSNQVGLAPYLKKGTHMEVMGRVEQGVYKGSDGEPRNGDSIRATGIGFGNNPTTQGQNKTTENPGPHASTAPRDNMKVPVSDDANDDLPF